MQIDECMTRWISAIFNKMTPENFDCFLHSLLFLHTERVIEAQDERETNKTGQIIMKIMRMRIEILRLIVDRM